MHLLNNDINLYRPEKKYYLESLKYAKNFENNNNNKLVFHCFWRVPREFGRKQVAVIMSILANHINKLDNLEINLWSNIDLSNNILLQNIKKYLNFKRWNLDIERKDSILENCYYITKESISDNMCYLEGDLFRLLVLNKYGGFYIDMDVLILRDMTPLNNLEFLYQWGTSGCNDNELVMTMNGAVMRFNKSSAILEEYLEILSEDIPYKDSTSWGNKLYSKLINNSILVLPCIWFNSEWGHEDTINDPFGNKNKIELFDGAFTWHWHNRWDDEIKDGSKFQILEEKHIDILNKNLLLNLSTC